MGQHYQSFMQHARLECRWAEVVFEVKEWMAAWRRLPLTDKQYFASQDGWNYWR
jgi:hypothetical protein